MEMLNRYIDRHKERELTATAKKPPVRICTSGVGGAANLCGNHKPPELNSNVQSLVLTIKTPPLSKRSRRPMPAVVFATQWVRAFLSLISGSWVTAYKWAKELTQTNS